MYNESASMLFCNVNAVIFIWTNRKQTAGNFDSSGLLRYQSRVIKPEYSWKNNKCEMNIVMAHRINYKLF